MKKTAVIYTGRLGDIVGTLPRSKWLHDHGYDVQHYCCDEFKHIFQATSYVRARVVPGDVVQAYETANVLAPGECDEVFDRQIYPKRTWDYRGSKKRWLAYYYADIPELITMPPLFDIDCLPPEHRLPKKSLLVSMHGISSPLAVDWPWVRRIIEKLKEMGEIISAFYTCGADESPPLLNGCDLIDHSPPHWLPGLMRSARLCLFRNSAPAWIAYGVGVPTLHLPDSCSPDQDTCGPAKNLIPLPHSARDPVVESAIEQALSLPWGGGTTPAQNAKNARLQTREYG
jgi:hypothetical protein